MFTLAGRKICWLWLALWLSLALVGCGDSGPTNLVLPTPQEQAGILPFQTAPAQLSPPPTLTVSPTAAIVAVPAIPTVTPQPTATPSPLPTATLAPTVTPTQVPEPTATATPALTSTATPDGTATTSSPAPTITAQPTINTTPAPVDSQAELKVVKAAYDAIDQHFYTRPDLPKIGQKGLEQAATLLKVTAPPALKWPESSADNWSLFQEQFNRLVSQSKVTLPPGTLAHRVVNAMAQATGDLHTYFLDETRSDTINRMRRGDNTTVGFGIYYVAYQNAYYVQRLVTGGPAQVAGVKVGDRLNQFAGLTISSNNFSQISQSKEGQSYDFVFSRPGESAPLSFSIPYKRYVILTAEWRVINGHIGFITLNAFHLDVTTRLDQALTDLQKKGIDSLIIDLRYNGGGYAYERVSGRFVADGSVLGKFTNRKGIDEIKAKSNGQQLDPPLPLAVLIDANSASASEIFSLAIRDYQAGVLVGGRTAGAVGSVNYWPLGDGTSLGVTQSVYETVKGEKFNGVGVSPDITIVRSTADILAGRDPQLEAALNYLAGKALP